MDLVAELLLFTIICEKLLESFSALFENISDSEVISAIENAAEKSRNHHRNGSRYRVSIKEHISRVLESCGTQIHLIFAAL
jgi:hypothetical protein